MHGASRWLWLCLLASSRAGDHVATELTESTFDAKLRDFPMALVVFHATWSPHSRQLLPVLDQIAQGFHDTWVAVARVQAESSGELIDRFAIQSFPTVLWFDSSKKWPFYASEDTPERYVGGHGFDSIASYLEQKSGAQLKGRERAAVSPSATATTPAAAAPAQPGFAEHACTDVSNAYVECMRHREDRPDMCARERRRYLFCMSSRWSVDPDEHAGLAAQYAQFAPAAPA